MKGGRAGRIPTCTSPRAASSCRRLGPGLRFRSAPQGGPECEGAGGALCRAHRRALPEPVTTGGELPAATMKEMDEPPLTIEEFLQAQNLEEWPKSTHLEYDAYKSALAVKKLTDACSFDKIYKHLCDNVPVRHKALLEMEFRMKDLFDDFQAHSNRFINLTQNSALEDHDRQLAKLRKMIDKRRKKTIFMYPYATTEKKTVENCTFLGCRVNMPSKLPRHLTASKMYLYVLKAQKPEVKSFKTWFALLLTQASVNLLQDAFWWWFLHKFKPNQHDEDVLFDRISENYVSLLMKIPEYRKDTFFKLYPVCLSQAIYTIFQEAFPDSSQLFNDAFKEELLKTTFLWMTGLNPPIGISIQWNLGSLEENTIHGNMKRMSKTRRGYLSDKEIASINMEFDLDKLIQDTQNALLSPVQETNLMARQSHPIGPGPDFCRFLFKVGGQSPLVAYYLKVHNIMKNPKIPYFSRIQMTHVFRWPTNVGPTYHEIVAESRKIFARNKAAYRVEYKNLKEEIRTIRNKQLEFNKTILSLENKAQWRPEEAMNDCGKYLEKLRQNEKKEKFASIKLPLITAAKAMASVPAFASCNIYFEDEEYESQCEKEPDDPEK
ncbi:protein FAM227B [Macrotis lagotis]|uniref:protein FAM227B n=1 Tax=Macrotis lagotis TaxID=92651 RepID=UPI003D69F5BF